MRETPFFARHEAVSVLGMKDAVFAAHGRRKTLEGQ